MKAIVTRYLNEIVGLSIMALMTIALIAAQSSALANQRSHLADQAAADLLTQRMQLHEKNAWMLRSMLGE